MSDTDALLATVRQVAGGLAEQQAMPDDWWQEKLDTALDSLAAELERRDKRIVELIEGHALQEYAAELERVKAERDKWRKQWERLFSEDSARRAEIAEARLDKALSALHWYADVLHENGSSGDRARAVIAEIGGES